MTPDICVEFLYADLLDINEPAAKNSEADARLTERSPPKLMLRTSQSLHFNVAVSYSVPSDDKHAALIASLIWKIPLQRKWDLDTGPELVFQF